MTPEQAAKNAHLQDAENLLALWEKMKGFSSKASHLKDLAIRLSLWVAEERADAVAEVWAELKPALDVIIKNDKTHYRHHEIRSFDGKSPKEMVDGGTRFLTPKEIAQDLLKLAPAQEGQA